MANINYDFKNMSIPNMINDYQYIQDQVNNTVSSIINNELSFNNSVRPFIDVYNKIYHKIQSFTYASNLHPNKEIRDKGYELSTGYEKFMLDIQHNKDLFTIHDKYYNSNFENENSNLTDEEVRYFENTMLSYKREGMYLVNSEFKEKKQKLVELESQFIQNVNNNNTFFVYTKDMLKGLSESWFTESRKMDNNYKVTLGYPDYIPASQYVDDENIRKELFIAFNSRGIPDNIKLFHEIVLLRKEVANMLGYKNYAEYKIEVSIVKTPTNVLEFEDNLNKLLESKYQDEMEKLYNFAKQYKLNPLNKDHLDPWDYPYYMRAYEQEMYNIDHEEIKQYFPINTVIQGMFEIYQNMFSLEFSHVPTDNKWHSDVELYSVTDKLTNKIIGYFYTDLCPREGKFGHAAAFNFLPKLEDTVAIVSIVANLDNSKDNACMTFDNLVTLFHEFGHVMHYILGKQSICTMSAFSTETDFVEVPSQCLEHWLYHEKPLHILSKHIVNSEHIPIDIVRNIKRSKNTFSGYNNKKQILYGLFDLHVHMLEDDTITNDYAATCWNRLEKEILGFTSDIQTYKFASFTHLMGGYDAGYYGYLRSNTYATNIFYKYFKDDPLNIENGMRLRSKLLEPAATKDGIDILVDFLGEEPDDSYFIDDILG